MIHRAELFVYLVALAVAAVVFVSAVGILLVRAARHVRWAIARWRDARGRRGDALEALAREIRWRS